MVSLSLVDIELLSGLFFSLLESEELESQSNSLELEKKVSLK